MKLIIGNTYRFITGEEILIYTGKEGNWHQFVLINESTVWAEVLDKDLRLLKEV